MEAASGSADSKVMVPRYTHLPGNHCGSTALRKLLAFHGCEISEELAFGLGAGACFFYFPLDCQSPSRFTNGRAARLEENFLELTRATLRLRADDDPDRCWEMAKEDIDAGRPVLLLTDLFYLDHYGKSAHFPGSSDPTSCCMPMASAPNRVTTRSVSCGVSPPDCRFQVSQ